MCWFIQTFRSSLGKKYIMAVTGFLLGGFLLVHAIGNSTIFFGGKAFNSYAHHLHSLGPFVPLFELCLLVIFLAHVITAVILFLGNQQASGGRFAVAGSKYAVQANAGGRTWGSRTMPYTGVIILLFILLHLVNFHFPEKTLEKPISVFVTEVLHSPGYAFLYLIGLAALLLHISHGFWSLLQTLGISHPKYDTPLRVIAWLLVAFMGAVFILVTLLLLFHKGQLALGFC